ncbi:DUF418 domain-containing protein [Halomonas sp. M5N1S17]|uniref:DUF418 domain-containing protein n=1 Tax=Halomonas alkalisoli TaxID=2907158 RepID=UPI001F44C0DD|nr:DUF418 domain-containing protein [Halomonas alkalisoli]
MQGTTEAGEAGPSLAPGGRVHSLDVLRGFALLGILVMNIQAFAMPMAAYTNPTAWGDLTGANFGVWLLSHLFADEKMMAIFSMLFGAGIVLFADHARQRGKSAAGLHYRRNAWLLLFGAAHGYLLWFGDILFLYAVCGFALFPFRNLSPRALFVLGLALLSVSSLLFLYFGWSMRLWPEAQLAAFEAEWRPAPAALAEEIAIYRGGWLEQLAHRAPITAEAQTFVLIVWGFWRAAGLMLIGMGLYRLGVLSGQASSATYWRLLMAGWLIGLPLVGYGVAWNFANGWGPESLFHGSQFNYWGSLPVSLGWVAAVVLLLRHGALRWLTRRLAAVGRMAFTLYILQTVIGVLLFYGQGLALFGQVERTGQIAIVLAIWLLQLLLAPIWLHHFRSGPLEWLWRSLTYGERQPFRRQ